ncbi:predicted protein [Plenodomus lingam JN3]|uniref:Predicted protein n=1 Tax=Leptosphaeria maculans (strain JN3 / isolate v23.1.3 / race Av1-4-5-6-7-8) TaxID=985895 RepID=E4ZHS5_LEPMJ|nr:predicted protein [Plenodomus lingam JN3]CBX90908.1 predicted protein [Plenodomus lingam JN3]
MTSTEREADHSPESYHFQHDRLPSWRLFILLSSQHPHLWKNTHSGHSIVRHRLWPSRQKFSTDIAELAEQDNEPITLTPKV